MNKKIKEYWYNLMTVLPNELLKRQIFLTFISTLIFFITIYTVIDNLIISYFNKYHHGVFQNFLTVMTKGDKDMDLWLSLWGLVIGTLILVISIAAQSTPKLIDLYTTDIRSLVFVWYITLGLFFSCYLHLTLTEGGGADTPVNVFHQLLLINSLFFLPLGFLLAVPYIIHILRYTKTANVVEKIFISNKTRLRRILLLAKYSKVTEARREEFQYLLFEAFNQYDNLLEYFKFKEPRGNIIEKMSLSLQNYIRTKQELRNYCPNFFKLSPFVREDISFKTMQSQLAEVEENQTFYEQKGFNLLGNNYIKLIEEGEFELASQCAQEYAACGKVAVELNDLVVADEILIHFNTLIRFGIKHGLKNKEARNLYNAVFHYGQLIQSMILNQKEDLIQKSGRYLYSYAKEIQHHSYEEKSFSFLVAVFTWELKQVLLSIHKYLPDSKAEKYILSLFCQLDNLSENMNLEISKIEQISPDVRSIQISLALFYLKNDREDLAEQIINDVLQSHSKIDRSQFIAHFEFACRKLRDAQPTFWEDTDRGTANLFYSAEHDQLDHFMELFYQDLKMIQ